MAQDFIGGFGWINTGGDDLYVGDLAGQVFLVHFWTYSCVNCIRTFRHLDGLYNTYNDLGFTIIGAHSPEFDFGKERMNVEAAFEKYGIDYPVILDNDFKIWREYQGRGGGYWPALFLSYPFGRISAIL